MKKLIVLLSVALIFVGIGAVIYVDTKTEEIQRKANSVKAENVETIFPKRQSMMEIDSITSAGNYPFTVSNAVTHADSASKSALTRKI